MSYTHTISLNAPFDETVQRTRALLADGGFGILTEINVRETFTNKLGAAHGNTLGDFLILGACNPALAERALLADPDLGAFLPCNVVIRRAPDAPQTVVQTINPHTMVELSPLAGIDAVATEVNARLLAVLNELESPSHV